MATLPELAARLQSLMDALASGAEADDLLDFVSETCVVPATHEVPQWLQLCQFLAVDLVATGELLNALSGDAAEHLYAPIHFADPAVCPTHVGCSRVAELAAHRAVTTPAKPPASFEECLVLDWLQDKWPARPVLSMSALLVSSARGMAPKGQAAKIDFWLVQPALLKSSTGVPRHLVRAPSFSLAQADQAFEDSLCQVNRLLAHLLQGDAPVVAFGVRFEPTLPHLQAPELGSIMGDSFTVALAVGAMWMLQQYLRTDRTDRTDVCEHAALADALAELRPERIVVTAALDTVVEPGAKNWSWPKLRPVGGIAPKLDLAHAWPEFVCQNLRLYTAADQPTPVAQVYAPNSPVQVSLLDVLLRMADECGRGLSPPQRLVYRQLIDGQEPSQQAWAAAISDAQHAPALQPGVEAWLLQRLGCLCSGLADAPLAAKYRPLPARLGPLFLERRGGSAPGTRLRLDQWLLDVALPADVFLVSGPAMSGKSSLLAQWEIETALRALRCLQERPGSPNNDVAVEVCVPVDVQAMLRSHRRSPITAKNVVSRVWGYLTGSVPWLNKEVQPGLPIRCIQAPDAGRPLIWAEGMRRHQVRIRMWIDGADLLPADACEALARWLALPQHGRLLPPVFAARDARIAPQLVAHGIPGRSRLAWAELLAWGAADWLAYVGRPGESAPAGLDAAQQAALARRLGFLAPDDAPPTEFQRLCRLPGQMAGVCEVLQPDGAGPMPQTPGRLLLSLLWRRMAMAAMAVPHTLQGEVIWGPAARPGALVTAATQGWPAGPLAGSAVGQLLMQLACLSSPATTAAVDQLCSSGGSARSGSRRGSDALKALDAACTAGLVSRQGARMDRVCFSQDAWHSLFRAMARNHTQIAPPLDLVEPTEAARELPLSVSLPTRLFPAAELQLPEPTAQQAEARLAADVADDAAAWVQRLVGVNLALAAQVAIDHLPALDAHRDLLDLLRCLLLWRSHSTGSETGGAGGAGDALAIRQGLNGRLKGLSSAWTACELPSVDVALSQAAASTVQRLQAGLLLGLLGDTLRYAPPGADDALVGTPRLRGPYWRCIVGTRTRMAALLVTQAEWDGFLASPDAWNPQANCWQQAGTAASAWLQAQLQQHAPPAVPGMGRGRWRGAWSNPLLPVTDVSLHAVRAYVAWLRTNAVYENLGWGLPDLPTEWEWQLAAQGLPDRRGDDLDPFNHAGLRWRRPSPVGTFAADASSDGVADLRGNVRQWCGSALDALQLHQCCERDNASRVATGVEPAAVRGSGHLQTAALSDPGSRQSKAPSHSAHDLGFRLVLRSR